MSANVFPVPFSGIQESIIDAKGDLIVGSAADTPIRLPVGTNNQMLVADSSVTGGVKWTDQASGGGMTLLSTTSLSGTTTSITGISQNYIKLFIVVSNWSLSGPAFSPYMFLYNGSTTANLTTWNWYSASDSGQTSGTFDSHPNVGSLGLLSRDYSGDGTNKYNIATITIDNYSDTTAYKNGELRNWNILVGGTNYSHTTRTFTWRSTLGVDRIDFSNFAGGPYSQPSFSGGTVKVYGVK